jgi:hypothetical protein
MAGRMPIFGRPPIQRLGAKLLVIITSKEISDGKAYYDSYKFKL